MKSLLSRHGPAVHERPVLAAEIAHTPDAPDALEHRMDSRQRRVGSDLQIVALALADEQRLVAQRHEARARVVPDLEVPETFRHGIAVATARGAWFAPATPDTRRLLHGRLIGDTAIIPACQGLNR